MTVEKLIELLQKQQRDAVVLLSKDPEGNQIWNVDELTFENLDEHDVVSTVTAARAVIIWPGW